MQVKKVVKNIMKVMLYASFILYTTAYKKQKTHMHMRTHTHLAHTYHTVHTHTH